jgi:hypothetical protein
MFFFVFLFFLAGADPRPHPWDNPHFMFCIFFVFYYFFIRRVDTRSTPDLPSSMREGFGVKEELCSDSKPHPWDRDFGRSHGDGTLERRGGWRRFQKRSLLFLPPTAPEQG